jgi:hypothetical protein
MNEARDELRLIDEHQERTDDESGLAGAGEIPRRAAAAKKSLKALMMGRHDGLSPSLGDEKGQR